MCITNMKIKMAKTLSLFAATVACVLFPTLVLGDYQIELDLRSYNNSGGKQNDGTCCEIAIPNTMPPVCFPLDTCDTRFNFNVRNFDTNMMYTDQTRTVSDYNDTDIINFPNCSRLINGQVNPLVFVIGPSTWGENEEIQFTVELLDIDFNPGTGTTDREEIGNIIIRILRPSAPSATFTMYQNYTAGFASLELRYRVICTPGTCGSTCSQTTNCNPFPSACSTTITPLDCDDSPCQNGGTCNTIPGGYRCDCPDAYSGANCEEFDACFSSPCENGGTCNRVPGSNDFSCTCPTTYTGTTCTDRATAAPPNPTNNTPRTTTSDGTVEPNNTDSGTQTVGLTTPGSSGTSTPDSAESYHTVNSIVLLALSLFVTLGMK